MANAGVSELDWLLDDLVKRVSGADRAVVLSADGLLIGKSGNLSEQDGEHLSAVASAFQSLARGTGRHFGGGNVRQTMVEMDHAFLFVTAAGRGACLALLAKEDADMGLVAYEMNLMVKRVGAVLTSAPRAATPPVAMSGRHESWFEDEAGPLVRSYAVTGGRTRSDTIGLDLITLVVAMRTAHEVAGFEPEYGRILNLCQRPTSVAEVAARIDLPLPVVKVLLSDLIEQNLVLFRTATPVTDTPNKHVLQAVLDGIRKL